MGVLSDILKGFVLAGGLSGLALAVCAFVR